ncbi:Flp pilus assembly complex ATPase component TadA [Wenzhouxiangella sp. XN79A]|nr:ATPase, T2SS/T4P/T4SS family [Wenzhouxiangella sp. XN79A]NKI36491.1 Flp pilus assembly complex ATPase component TadA [Wenzhouxiangella sp. XN79A]
MLSGHGIPGEQTVRQILERIPRVKSSYYVMLVGCGSGYLAGVLSRLARHVVAIERQEPVARIARRSLEAAGIDNVEVRVGEGEDGAADAGPFDLVLTMCSLAGNARLIEQLTLNGSLIALERVGQHEPELVQYRKHHGEVIRRSLGPISFERKTGDILIDLGYIDEDALEKAREEAQRRQVSVLDVIRRNLRVEDVGLYRSLARQHGIEFARADDLLNRLDSRLFQSFSSVFLENQRLIPIRIEDHALTVATDDPDAQTEDLRAIQPANDVVKVLVTPTDFRRLWSNIDLTRRGSDLLQWGGRDTEDGGIKDLLDSNDPERELSHHLVSIYEAILLDAVSAGASDIHIERYGRRIRIRLRIDGELHDLDYYQLGPKDHAGLINVIKVQAEINIAERRLPQGGRSQMRVGKSAFDLRVQIQPSLHGEHAVIRLLSQTGRALGLRELGMSRQVADAYERLLDNPSGLVLVVGPTGSGKSTTLYAGLQQLADDGRRKVITVEDPIEYSIDNIQQTRVRSEIGFNFADAMRAFVREDPDVILVGEIRDMETAMEAIRASQTGHIVLSTLHCNDAVDALQRMYDLGVHPNSIAGELLAVIAQRLAKRICPKCREEVEPDPAILRELFPDGPPTGFRSYIGRGCSECGGRGTRGRIAIVEYLHVNDAVRNHIAKQPPIGELRWRALDSGLITMRDSALDHVIEGVIPLSELPRLLPQERMAPEQRGGLRPE